MESGDTSTHGYVPVKLASEKITPKSGEDKSLNPIIYHHALDASKELWHEIPQMIADKTKRVSYTYDMRCHGDSEWSDSFNSQILIEDLRHFMDSMNVKKAVLVGHSIGGRIISMFAAKYPDKVEMIINEDGSIIEDTIRAISTRALDFIKNWATGVKAAPKNSTEEDAVKFALDYTYEKLQSLECVEDKKVMCQFKYPIKKTNDGYVVKHDLETISKYLTNSSKGQDDRNIDGVYKGPALFMMASKSNFRDGIESEDVKKKFPNVEVQILENVTHNIHLAYPEKFIETFMTFYEKHCPQSSA